MTPAATYTARPIPSSSIVHPYYHRSPLRWNEGDVAFLKKYCDFEAGDRHRLIDSGYLHRGATGHPVVVVRALNNGEVVVAPVSAFSSGPGVNFLPPWRMPAHAHRNPAGFRSFAGSERSPKAAHHPILQLKDGGVFPKPRTSWIFIQSVWQVPASTLSYFDKAPVVLRLTDASLYSLQQHIAKECRRYRPSWGFHSGPSGSRPARPSSPTGSHSSSDSSFSSPSSSTACSSAAIYTAQTTVATAKPAPGRENVPPARPPPPISRSLGSSRSWADVCATQ